MPSSIISTVDVFHLLFCESQQISMRDMVNIALAYILLILPVSQATFSNRDSASCLAFAAFPSLCRLIHHVYFKHNAIIRRPLLQCQNAGVDELGYLIGCGISMLFTPSVRPAFDQLNRVEQQNLVLGMINLLDAFVLGITANSAYSKITCGIAFCIRLYVYREHLRVLAGLVQPVNLDLNLISLEGISGRPAQRSRTLDGA